MCSWRLVCFFSYKVNGNCQHLDKPVGLHHLPECHWKYTFQQVEVPNSLDYIPVVVLSCIDEYAGRPVEDAAHKLDHNHSHSTQEVQSSVLQLQLHGRVETTASYVLVFIGRLGIFTVQIFLQLHDYDMLPRVPAEVMCIHAQYVNIDKVNSLCILIIFVVQLQLQ